MSLRHEQKHAQNCAGRHFSSLFLRGTSSHLRVSLVMWIEGGEDAWYVNRRWGNRLYSGTGPGTLPDQTYYHRIDQQLALLGGRGPRVGGHSQVCYSLTFGFMQYDWLSKVFYSSSFLPVDIWSTMILRSASCKENWNTKS